MSKNNNKFKNTISQYDYIAACIVKYNELVNKEGCANIKQVVKSLKDDAKEINRYKELFIQYKQNNISQNQIQNQLKFNNKYISMNNSNDSFIDIINI